MRLIHEQHSGQDDFTYQSSSQFRDITFRMTKIILLVCDPHRRQITFYKEKNE